MNNLTEIKITNIPPRSKIGIIGDVLKGKILIEHFINRFKYDFNIIFSTDFETKTDTLVKYTKYDKKEEYNFIFNHLIKYIDYSNYSNDYLIIFDEYCNNNYFLQKIYFSSNLTIITNNFLQLHLQSMHNYIIIFYIADETVQLHLYNVYFSKFYETFNNFKIMFDNLNQEPYKTLYTALVVNITNDTSFLYYLKNTFNYEIEI